MGSVWAGPWVTAPSLVASDFGVTQGLGLSPGMPVVCGFIQTPKGLKELLVCTLLILRAFSSFYFIFVPLIPQFHISPDLDDPGLCLSRKRVGGTSGWEKRGYRGCREGWGSCGGWGCWAVAAPQHIHFLSPAAEGCGLVLGDGGSGEFQTSPFLLFPCRI